MLIKIFNDNIEQQHNEFNAEIIKHKRCVEFFIESPIQENILTFILNSSIEKELFIECENNIKISLKNYSYIRKAKDEKMIISVKGQYLYEGNEFIYESISYADEVSVCFGQTYQYDINKKMYEIFDDENEFIMNNSIIELKRNNVVIKNYNSSKTDLMELYEILWIIYGFFPPIQFIKYKMGNEEITEYIDLVYNRISNREHFLKENKIVNINQIKNLSDVIYSWREFKNKYGETFINFLFYTTSFYSKYINVQFCNLIQAIDGYTDILYKDNRNKEKIGVIDNLSRFLNNISCDKNIKNGLDSALKSLERDSLKVRIDLFISQYDEYNIFYEERLLKEKYDNESSECAVYLKYNKILTEMIEQRNILSHIKKQEEWDYKKIKNYYWKMLLLIRLSILKYLNLNNNVDKNNINKNLEEINNWYKKQNNELCRNCKFYINNSCDLLIRGGKNNG